METVVVKILHSQLKKYPPKSPIDIIRTAKILIQEMKFDVSINDVIEIVSRGEESEVMRGVRDRKSVV